MKIMKKIINNNFYLPYCMLIIKSGYGTYSYYSTGEKYEGYL